MPRLLIRGARQVVTFRGSTRPRRGGELRQPGIVENGALLIEDGRIADVGPARRIENLRLARDAVELQAGGGVILPGFHDCSTALLAVMPAAGAVWGMLHRLLAEADTWLPALLQAGTTSLGSDFGDGVEAASVAPLLRHLDQWLERQQVNIAVGLNCTPDNLRIVPQLRQERLVQFLTSGSQFRASSDAACLRRMRALAGSCGWPLLDPVSIASLENPATLFALAESAEPAVVVPARNPAASPPVSGQIRKLADAGAAIALGTGFHPRLQPLYSIPDLIAVACTHLLLTPAEAIAAVTVNGAHALGRGRVSGTIEPGKRADLVIADLADYHDLATPSLRNPVRQVVVRGTPLPQLAAAKAAAAGGFAGTGRRSTDC